MAELNSVESAYRLIVPDVRVAIEEAGDDWAIALLP